MSNQLVGNMVWKYSDVFRFDLGSLLRGKTRIAKLKSVYNSLIIGPRLLGCETKLQEIMGWESSDMVRFDLEPHLQGQTTVAKLNSAYNSLIISPRDLGWQNQPLGYHGLEIF